jgi:pimeloyl-ACP methyl ester carboxylesterase
VWAEASRFDPRGAALIRQGFLEHTPHAMTAILREVLASVPAPAELAAELAKLDVPVLVIAGSNDGESLPPSEQLAQLLPNARLVVVPGAGHVVNLADPARFNQALGEFLDQLGV